MSGNWCASGKEIGGVPLVVAVVLTWNDTELTQKCLQSVLGNDYPNLKVVLVDNGSTPPRGPELQRMFPQIALIQNPFNQGFSGGANRGLEKALEMGADFVQLIGNDAILDSAAISNLIVAARDNPEAGAIGPLLLEPGEEQIVQFFTASIEREKTQHIHHDFGADFKTGNWPVQTCDFIPCVALMFRAKALKQVGLFDESFGTCWEDYDLCLRLHDAGWEYIAVGDAVATHLGSHTTGRESPYIVYYTTRNRLICIQRHAGEKAVRHHLFFYIRSFINYARRYGLLNWKCHQSFVRAFWHYFRNVKGEQAQSHKLGKIPGLEG